jgi:VWFA-related protein
MNRRHWAVIAAFCAVALPLAAQQPTFSTRKETVRLDVLVTDRGRPVRDLQATDFEILDSGVPQQVEFFSFEQLPLALVLALDDSASISAASREHLRNGGRALLGGLEPKDQAALLTFADVITLRESLTTASDRVRGAFDNFEPRRQLFGDTALIDACYTAMTVLDATPSRGIVIAFTDGVDTSSWLTPSRVLQAARRSDVVVYGISTSSLPKRSFLRELSETTGGGALEIPSTAGVTDAFLRILEEFRQRYVIAFSPVNVPVAGWHPLTVRVKNRRLDVKARAGYSR